jgi:hypothetical protein
MKYTPRPFAYWVIIGFLLVSLILLLAGQTMAIVDYDLAVALGLQESADDIGQHGVQVNRAFGTSDTFVYIPLIILSIVGLVRRKRWGLYLAAAVMGISAYWVVTIAFMMLYLAGIPGYYLEPGIEYWIFMGAFMIFGVGGLLYLVLRGDRLIT